MAPDVRYEQDLLASGYRHIAGLDEAGRGCWAGPVVAAAVVFPPHILAQPDVLAGIDDSKLLSPHQREETCQTILSLAEGVGVGIVGAFLIDTWGIVPATRLAMTVALLSLPCLADALLIDALPLPTCVLPQKVLIKGDSRSLIIAAASVVAKVSRDHLMHTAHLAHPAYGFASHKGYGTAAHRRALASCGPCVLHRRSFRPVAALEHASGHAEAGNQPTGP